MVPAASSPRSSVRIVGPRIRALVLPSAPSLLLTLGPILGAGLLMEVLRMQQLGEARFSTIQTLRRLARERQISQTTADRFLNIVQICSRAGTRHDVDRDTALATIDDTRTAVARMRHELRHGPAEEEADGAALS